LVLAELALANEQRRQEAAKQAAALAELALAKEQHCHEAAMQTAMSVESSLTNEHCRHEAAAEAEELAELVLPRSNVATRQPRGRKRWPMTHASDIAKSLPNALRHWQSWHWPWSKPRYWPIWRCLSQLWKRISNARRKPPKKQPRSDDERIMVPVLLPHPINKAIWHIRVECALLTAPLDAILAKIEHNKIAHKAQALLTTTSPHPAAMLSTPPPAL
jgi:hypothetical protein